MFPSQAFIIFVALDDFGDIVDIVSGRIGILIKSVKLFMFWNLRDKFLEIHLLRPFLISAPLIFPLFLASASAFE